MPAFVVPGLRFLCDDVRMTPTPQRAVLSPCVGICSVDAQGVCEGCLRTLDEIARWSTMGDAERLRVMCEVLPRREADRDPTA